MADEIRHLDARCANGGVRIDTDAWIPHAEDAKPSLLLNADTLFADRYRVQGVLGAGGSGVVYRVFDRVLEREVALKILRRGASDRDLKRFRREVALAQRLSHPGVIRVHDIGTCGEYDFYSMELVEGESLAERLRRQGPLTIGEVRALLVELASAVGYLHESGVIHRDVKPANVLIDRLSGRFLLGDLGLARVTDDTGLSATNVVGTPFYMAPEQLMGKAPDARTDLYSLGATLYEALTGRRTHEGALGAEVAVRKTKRAPAPISRLRPGAPADLALVIERCLERSPAGRFESIASMLASYSSLSASGSFGPTVARVGRLARRIRGLRLALAALGVLAIAGWTFRGDALWVRAEGSRAVGVNFWGGAAWTWDLGQENVSVGRWCVSRQGPRFFAASVPAMNSMPFGRTVLLSRRGEKILDSAEVEEFLPSTLDPRNEFSGIVGATPMGWASGPPDRERPAIPVVLTNYPWYFTVLMLSAPGGAPYGGYCSTGRVHWIAYSADRCGVVCGNNEILHMSAFALLSARNPEGWSPPRMLEQPDKPNNLISYTLLPIDEHDLRGCSFEARSDGTWRVWGGWGCEVLDHEGNRQAVLDSQPGVAPEVLRARRTELFSRLSQIDLSRRRGVLDAAESNFRELLEDPPQDPVELAALYWVGARVAAERCELENVIERSQRCGELWPVTADPDLLRARARSLAGHYDLALKDIDRAQTKIGSTADDLRILRLNVAWLSGDHSLAMRLAEAVVYPYEKAKWQAFVRIGEGDPAAALRILDPWADHWVRDRVQLLRAIALIDLGRTAEAREALQAEVDRHGWLREECDWASFAADLADGKRVTSDRARSMLARVEQRSRTELEVRVLLPRWRIEAAEALFREGWGEELTPIIDEVTSDSPGPMVASRARELRAALRSRR